MSRLCVRHLMNFAFRLLMPLFLLAGSTHLAQAETITVALSQEQDGGDAGRACIYVYSGKAEYRLVKPGEACAPEITVTTQSG